MQEFIEVKNQIENFGNKVGRLQGELSVLQKNYNDATQRVEVLKHEVDTHQKAVELLNIIQQATTEKTKKQIEELITFCLQFITQEDYQFKMIFSRRGNLGELDLQIQPPNETESWNPLEGSGGGINNVVSFALRIVLAEISHTNGFLIFDEPFSSLSENYRPRANLLLEELQKRLNRQFIQISHDPTLKETSYNQIVIN